MRNNKPINIKPFHHLYPFQSNYLDRMGLKYHYLDEGRGDPIIMLHGNPTWSFYYRSLVNGLSSQFRTIVPDHMGCGLSDKPDENKYGFRLKNRVDDLEALLEHLKIKNKITLVLHDWGGMIGMAYAVRHPEQISRIIMMNTAAFFPPGNKKIPLRLWMIRNLVPFAVPAVLGLNLFSYCATFMAAHKRLPKDVKKGLTAPYNSWNNRIATLKFVQDIPLIEKDYSFSMVKNVNDNLGMFSNHPILICWGLHDFVFDKSYFEEWLKRLPDAEAHLFHDAGHYVLEDVPDKVLDHIVDFLNRHPL
jgi:pimeloyl-ACP methyl ester carboxylesterase